MNLDVRKVKVYGYTPKEDNSDIDLFVSFTTGYYSYMKEFLNELLSFEKRYTYLEGQILLCCHIFVPKVIKRIIQTMNTNSF